MKLKKDIINHERSSQGLKLFSEQTQNLLQDLIGKKGVTSLTILKNWNQIVGEELSAQTLPERIDFKKDLHTNGTLFIIVSSGAYALEIQHKSPLIIEKINTYFGYQAVEHIKIIQNAQFFENKQNINVADIKKKKLVTKMEKTYIDSIIEQIADEKLKEKISSLVKTYLHG